MPCPTIRCRAHPLKYERTAFFDAIIERGLRDGTKFNIDHVTTDEKTTLGIAFDRATEKFFLAAYGTPKAGRSTGRRGSLTSQTSSDGDGSDQQLQNKERSHRHPVVKELSDFLLAEIEAAGKDAEVKTLKHRVMPEPSSGCKIIQFSVSIRRRAPRGFGQAPQAEGAGAGPTTVAVSTAQAADAGGGKPSAPSPSRSPQRGKRGSPKVSTTPSLSLGPGAPLASGNGVSPKRFPQSNSPSRSRGLQELKSRCRPLSAVNCEGDEGWDGVGGEDISKRRKRVAHPVFANAPKVDAMAVPKQEAQPAGSDASHRPDMRLGRMTLMDGGIRPQAPTPNLGAVRPSYLPPGVASMIPPLQRGANSAAVQHSGTSSSSRSYLPGPISSAWNSKSWIPNAGVGTGSRTIPTQTSREITAGAPDPSAPSAAPPSSTSTSWGFNAAPSRRNADFVAHSSSSRVMGSAESRAAVVTTTMATATTPGLTSFMSLPPLPPLSQPGCQYQRPQHHGEGMPFGARGVTTQTQDQLLPYLEQGRQQRQAALDDKSSSSYECWDTAPVPREIGAPGPGKDTEDDNLDFLGVFF